MSEKSETTMEEDKLEVPRIPNPIVNPTYMDICWEFADSEIFLVDAQALIQLFYEENKETMQDFGVNSLHLVYLIERFLHAFKDRGGDFTLVFFSDKRLRTNPLLTDVLIHHFKMNTSVRVITQFSSPFDSEFETFVLKNRPSFILGDFRDNLFMFRYFSIKLNVAHIQDITRTVVKRNAWYHKCFSVPERIMKNVESAYFETKKKKETPSTLPDYYHSGSGSLNRFYDAILDNCDNLSPDMVKECSARIYLYFLADVIKTRLTIYERRQMFPSFYYRVETNKSEMSVKCISWLRDLICSNLFLYPHEHLAVVDDNQLKLILIQRVKETGAFCFLDLIEDQAKKEKVAEDLEHFEQLRVGAEAFFIDYEIKLKKRFTKEKSFELENLHITTHPLHTLYPKEVLDWFPQDRILPATNSSQPRYKQFDEENHWHSNKKISSEFDRIKHGSYSGKSGQMYSRFMQRYGESLEGSNIKDDPIICKKEEKKKGKDAKTSGNAIELLRKKLVSDVKSGYSKMEERVKMCRKEGVQEQEDVLQELKIKLSNLQAQLSSLQGKAGQKQNKKVLADIEKDDNELKGSFAPLIQKLVHSILKLRYKAWKQLPSDATKIKILLHIKNNINVIKEFKSELMEDVVKYTKEIDCEELGEGLAAQAAENDPGLGSKKANKATTSCKQDKTKKSTAEQSEQGTGNFIRYQLKKMEKYITKTAPKESDPRVNFNPDLWQRDIFDAIDARESALIIAPTSSGKTYAAYYAMESVLRESDDGVVVFVAPNKALVNQVAATVCARFSKRKQNLPPGKSVYGTFTRDYRFNTTDCQILITVPECLEILLMCPIQFQWTKKLRYVIFDEVHNIGGESRGEVWENLLTLIRCPLIALSATVQNPKDLINWLQTLENYKEEMDRASGRVEMRRSYKVRMIPESGKIERHSDLVKYKYYSGEDGTDGITYVHPISYLNAQELLNKGSFPECMTFSPSECLDLFDVMAVKFGVDAVQNVDPLVLFPGNRFLDREDIQIFNSSISSFILKLENNLENMEKLNEVISHFPGLTKDQAGVYEEKNYLMDNFPALVKTLQKKNMLPALVFTFDRRYCVRLPAELTETFKEEIEEIKITQEYKEKQKRQEKNEKAMKKIVKKMKNEAAESDKTRKNENSVSREVTCVEDISPYGELMRIFQEFPMQTLVGPNNLDRDSMFNIMSNLKLVSEDYMEFLKYGISYHHAGNNSKMRSTTEMLFREKFLNLVVCTTTLAQGIHMPCQTVVFAGDSVFLNSLNYHQCSGRAGRRGFDQQGNVIFFGIRESKIARLMNSNLPLISGNSPISISKILKLFLLTSDTRSPEDRKDAIAKALGSLKNPLLILRNKSIIPQLQIFFLFAVEFLLKQDYIDEAGHAIGFSGIVTHLSFHEPYNFAFCHLLQEGVLHSLITRNSKREITEKSLRALVLVLNFMFGEVPASSNKEALPPLPTSIQASVDNYNKSIYSIYHGFLHTAENLFYKPHYTSVLPLSGLEHDCPDTGFVDPLAELAGVTSIPDDAIDTLSSNLRRELVTEALPKLEKLPINGYALEFFISGDLTVVKEKFRIQDTYQDLHSFMLVLMTIKTSLLEIGPDSSQDTTDDLIDAFTEITNRFTKKFNKAFGIEKETRRWGCYRIHEINCYTCSVMVEGDVVENSGRKWSVKGALDCKSEQCVVFIKCHTCRIGYITTCLMSVAAKIDSLRTTSIHFKEHEVSLMVISRMRKGEDLNTARIQWMQKLRVQNEIK